MIKEYWTTIIHIQLTAADFGLNSKDVFTVNRRSKDTEQEFRGNSFNFFALLQHRVQLLLPKWLVSVFAMMCAAEHLRNNRVCTFFVEFVHYIQAELILNRS